MARCRNRPLRAVVPGVLLLAVCSTPAAQKVLSSTGILPAGSRIGNPTLREPRQILRAEAAGGKQSYLVAIGNMAFDSPGILGPTARAAGLSCNSCHTAGAINRDFFIPGMSRQPGSADVTNTLFAPHAADGLANAINIPSLRGVRLTAPYGRDGRMASLRAFVRNVIVNEFGGPEPSPLLLDGLVAYLRQIAFLPNPLLQPDGQLTDAASDAAQRGAALFRKPFPQMGGRSCASCHTPNSAFTDGEQYNVGTGGVYETPALLNANYTAPYFADGSAANYAEVVEHFNTFYNLNLSARQQADLVAYLKAVGKATNPFVTVSFENAMDELTVFADTLPRSLKQHRGEIVRLTVDTMNAELREIREQWPAPESREPRSIIAGWILQLRQVAMYSRNGRWEDALAVYHEWRTSLQEQRARVANHLQASLYNPAKRAAYRTRFDAMLSGPESNSTNTPSYK